MSRALGGRTNLASRANPIFIPAPIGHEAVGIPCICTGGAVDGVNHGAGYTATGGAGLTDYTDRNTTASDAPGVLCSSDMSVSLTVSSLTAHASAYPVARVDLGARMAGYATLPFNGQGYVFSFWTHGGGPTHEYQLWNDYLAVSPAYTSAAAGPLANGDTLELIVNGSSVIAKFNGSTIFSVTDTNIGTSVSGQPTSYSSYRVTAAGTSDIGTSAFAATSIC